MPHYYELKFKHLISLNSLKFLCFLKPIWQADSWILLYFLVSLWQFIFYLRFSVVPGPSRTYPAPNLGHHFSSSNDCRLPATGFCKSHLSFSYSSSKYLGGYMEGSSALSSTRGPCFSLLPSFDLHGGLQNTGLAAVTQVSPNFLSFRFLGTVLLWKLSEVFCFLSMCKNQTISVF